MQYRCDTLRYGVYTAILISQYVIEIFICWRDQSDILDVIFQRGDWFHYQADGKDVSRPELGKGGHLCVNVTLSTRFEERFQEIIVLDSYNRRH